MFIRRLPLVAALLVVLPSLVVAQRRGESSRSRGPDKMDMSEIGKGGSPSKELEKQNPVAFILDKKKDLKLGDDEVSALKTINDQLKDSVKVYLKAIDSVQKSLKSSTDGPSSGEMFVARKLTQEQADSVNAHYERALEAAVAKLSADHSQAASELLDKQREEWKAVRRGGRPPATTPRR